MTARHYNNTTTEGTLTSSVTSADTELTLTSFSGYPSVPFTAVIDRGTASEEVVLVTAASSGAATVTRGYDGTTAKSQAAGASFLHVVIAKDYVEANDHVNATTGAHGITGAPVGTTDTQTLTNKTLTAPTVSGGTFSGSTALATATVSGSLTVTGATALSSLTTSGNASVGGTLTVTGATTLAALAATTGTFSGVLTGTTGTFSGLVTASTVPTAGGHLVNKTYADALGVATATASTIVRRDSSGNTAIDAITLTDAPTAAGHATRKDYVDGEITDLIDAFSVGRQAITVEGQVATSTALTPTITITAAAVPTRVVFTASGRTGFAGSTAEVSWEFDTTPAAATSVTQDDDGTKVTAPSGDFVTVATTLTMDVPAGTAATARLVLRSSTAVYNRGGVTWIRVPT